MGKTLLKMYLKGSVHTYRWTTMNQVHCWRSDKSALCQIGIYIWIPSQSNNDIFSLKLVNLGKTNYKFLIKDVTTTEDEHWEMLPSNDISITGTN